MIKHPADELFGVREQIAVLQSTEAKLKSWLITHASDRVGTEYTATVYFDRVWLTRKSVAAPAAPTEQPVAQPAVKSEAPQAWLVRGGKVFVHD